MSKPEAARRFGISLSDYYNYETGQRRGREATAVEIPVMLGLACSALVIGLAPYGEEAGPDIGTRFDV